MGDMGSPHTISTPDSGETTDQQIQNPQNVFLNSMDEQVLPSIDDIHTQTLNIEVEENQTQTAENPEATTETEAQTNAEEIILDARVFTRTNAINNHSQLFQALFFRVAVTYARIFPPKARRLIEFMLLVNALIVLCIFIHVHYTFVRSPVTCLDHLIDPMSGTVNWPRQGILRVELIRNASADYNLTQSYHREYSNLMNGESILNTLGDMENSTVHMNESDVTPESEQNLTNTDEQIEKDVPENELDEEDLFTHIFRGADYLRDNLAFRLLYGSFKDSFTDMELFAKTFMRQDLYIVEYSMEYGFLRLPPKTRKRLNISVQLVTIDLINSPCLGGRFNRMLLEEFLGYEDILMGSVRRLAEKENNQGYMRNVVTGDQFRFISSSMSYASYFIAGFIMLLFTVSVSMLLRYSHHQIFLFIADLMQMLENNMTFTFPAAPLLTVILALVGMEAIMTEFFNDTTTAFYTILVIWVADQYDAICCHTNISKHYWPRFFFLYHFTFYAYHYRFHGQYSGLALLTTWLFIQHSMVYFFHHYELPMFLHQYYLRERNGQPTGRLDPQLVLMQQQPINLNGPAVRSPAMPVNITQLLRIFQARVATPPAVINATLTTSGALNPRSGTFPQQMTTNGGDTTAYQ